MTSERSALTTPPGHRVGDAKPHTPLNVVLTGFMGTGKSTVGRLLAERLNREWIDTDQLIASRFGDIPSIFATQGESHFRVLERQTAAELSTRRNLVISTGGRLLLDPEARRHLEPVSQIFCLVARPETIYRRIGKPDGRTPRPLIDGPDPEGRLRQLLEERASGYARFESVDTEGKSPAEVAQHLASLLKDRWSVDGDD